MKKSHWKSLTISAGLIVFGIFFVSGCRSNKPVLMNRNGVYKFSDDAPDQYFLYLTEKKEWKKTPKKISPSTEMVIIYEEP